MSHSSHHNGLIFIRLKGQTGEEKMEDQSRKWRSSDFEPTKADVSDPCSSNIWILPLSQVNFIGVDAHVDGILALLINIQHTITIGFSSISPC
ncbi:Hypothetical predicted protein [Xyrichtys novacula]|uniref:Uncharacterized protein n=1 Tax=Xyrichtys novacula TaxID=13765 RepID=A0AAV1H624_XYRNO|nr:Hypothetical predicted protein [Xyrichtys novacula]